jgi:hypothetical protein
LIPAVLPPHNFKLSLYSTLLYSTIPDFNISTSSTCDCDVVKRKEKRRERERERERKRNKTKYIKGKLEGSSGG